MNGTIWIAEDDPMLRRALAAALRGKGFTVVETARAEDARLWMTTPGRPVILDGSVWRATGVPLEQLPKSVLLFTTDDDLVADARAKGVRVFLKGNRVDYQALFATVEKEVKR